MIGPHIIIRTDAALAWARRAPIVKVIGDPFALRQAQAGAITIFRSFFTQSEQDAFNIGMILDRTFVQLDSFRPTYIELFNEHAVRLSERLADHMALVKAAVPQIHAYGSKVAAFSFPVGCPEADDWLYIRDHNFGDADAIALHEYWAKQGFSDWTALRHRRVHEWLNGHHPPFIITECGRDAVRQEGGDKQPGWKLQGVSSEDYAAELRAYNAQIEKDAYVIGATVFTAGPTGDWDNFSTDEISHLIPSDSVAPQGGETMPWDRHEVFDLVQKKLGGQGYNPADAFGQYIAQHAGSKFGVYVGPILGYDRDDWPYLVQPTTLGALLVPKANAIAAAVRFCTVEADFPLA